MKRPSAEELAELKAIAEAATRAEGFTTAAFLRQFSPEVALQLIIELERHRKGYNPWIVGGWNKAQLDEEKIRHEYTVLQRPVPDIAKDMGVCAEVIYRRLRTMGVVKTRRKGVRAPAWNNKGGSTDSAGYRLVHVKGKQVREHRVVAEKMLGRKLKPGEVVHHKNGDRSDNRPENLQVLASHSEHMKEHARERLAMKANGVEPPAKE